MSNTDKIDYVAAALALPLDSLTQYLEAEVAGEEWPSKSQRLGWLIEDLKEHNRILAKDMQR